MEAGFLTSVKMAGLKFAWCIVEGVYERAKVCVLVILDSESSLI